MQTVFFWSEEHAAKFRAQHRLPDGLYLNMQQAAFSGRIAQSGLFAIGDDGCLQR
jgi:hypothetical protein